MQRSGVLSSLLVLLAVSVPPAAAQDADESAATPDTEPPAASQDVEPLPAYSREGADTCLACHDDAGMLEVFRTPHGLPGDHSGPFGNGQLQCEACHGPGDAHAGRVRRGQERPPISHFVTGLEEPVPEQNGVCIDCHQAELNFGWHDDAHSMADVACIDCHDIHDTFDKVLQTEAQPEVCASCHLNVHNETQKAFAHPIVEGKMTCTACHSPHGDTVASALARETVNQTCDTCHADKRGPYLWEHAPVAEDCTTCHEPHGSNQPAMLTKRAPLLCQGCHSQAGHPSIAFDTGGLADGVPSQYLLGEGCLNCHSQVHGSNHPSGSKLMR
jgi:DmsE family decaheme c-type cytochrome